MIWKTPKGEPGVRVVRRFAFLPVNLDSGYTIWLRWYWAKEEEYCVPHCGWFRYVRSKALENPS